MVEFPVLETVYALVSGHRPARRVVARGRRLRYALANSGRVPACLRM
jgi:hypothetical protein